MTPSRLAQIRRNWTHRRGMKQVHELCDEIEAQQKSLKLCHDLLAWALSQISPDENAEMVDQINRQLLPCDEANHCPEVTR